MSITAFVPARSGSKRLPGKNVKLLGGKPLILWALEAFLDAPSIERIIFSTDSLEYWEIATSQLNTDRLQLDMRSKSEAGDQVKIFDYLKEGRDKIFTSNDDLFVMGLPTVPFRRSEHIESAIEMYRKTGRAVFSATEYEFPISFAFCMTDDGDWAPADEGNPLMSGNTRSQDQRQAYRPNGAVYVRSVQDLANPALNTLYQGAVPYLMDRRSSLDIDSAEDFDLAEALFAISSKVTDDVSTIC